MRFRSFLVTAAAVIVLALEACSQVPAYTAGREACLQASATCEDYVACATRVAVQTGGPLPLPCKAPVDAGADQGDK